MKLLLDRLNIRLLQIYFVCSLILLICGCFNTKQSHQVVECETIGRSHFCARQQCVCNLQFAFLQLQNSLFDGILADEPEIMKIQLITIRGV